MTTFWKGIEKKDTKIHPFQKGVLFTDIEIMTRVYVCVRASLYNYDLSISSCRANA